MRSAIFLSGIIMLFGCAETPPTSTGGDSGGGGGQGSADAQASDTGTVAIGQDAAALIDSGQAEDSGSSTDSGQTNSDATTATPDAGHSGPLDSGEHFDAQGPGFAFNFYTPAWNDGDMVPSQFTCAGPGGWNHQNNPELRWEHASLGTSAFVMIFDDPDAGGWEHWAFYTDDETTTSIPASSSNRTSLPSGVTELSSGDGRTGYVPNCPGGAYHTYRWRLWAVDNTFVPTTQSFAALERAANAASLEMRQFTGRSNARQ